ncbi:unnamed protein product [Protopolystoma xenopodis]|nr:unnamed protein product [Protopolystoma xenopodis]
MPTPVEKPKLVVASKEAFLLLDFPPELADASVNLPDDLKNKVTMAREDLIMFLCGNSVWPGADPIAHCYCGIQFGNFAGQLGDGAAM